MVLPFVKWVGGKRQLLVELHERLPDSFGKYHEPFIGGGALFFSLSPTRAVISDLNTELINVYKVIKRSVEDLIVDLKQHKNESDYYYALRNIDRDPEAYSELTDVQRASRFIYLNKTCFNGLYRVNKQGFHNAAFANHKNPTIVDEANLREVAEVLKPVRIECMPFLGVRKFVAEGDFVYFDPPYAPPEKKKVKGNFTSYTIDRFDSSDLIDLVNLCKWLDSKGVYWMVSNNDTQVVRDLFHEFHVDTVQAARSVNCDGRGRGKVPEVLIRNYR